jgi:uncharacterized protein YbaR (Trm112 family)
MPAESSYSFDETVMGQLACPACLGAFRVDGDRLVCIGCGRSYPVVDGIPALIAARAEDKLR